MTDFVLTRPLGNSSRVRQLIADAALRCRTLLRPLILAPVRPQRVNRRLGAWFGSALALGLFGAVSLLGMDLAPAYAWFYQQAEEFMVNAFPASELAIRLTVNALRAFYLIYLAASIIGAVKAAQNDEDWQTVARTPLIVTVAVVVGDALTTLIIPAAATP
jgi:hypothetical protein